MCLSSPITSSVALLESPDSFVSVDNCLAEDIPPNGNVQIYRACEERGRIAYKRSGGSRLITHNDHWKSQIRHALYTCNRFKRYGHGVLTPCH